jgi:hypothetical protein
MTDNAAIILRPWLMLSDPRTNAAESTSSKCCTHAQRSVKSQNDAQYAKDNTPAATTVVVAAAAKAGAFQVLPLASTFLRLAWGDDLASPSHARGDDHTAQAQATLMNDAARPKPELMEMITRRSEPKPSSWR